MILIPLIKKYALYIVAIIIIAILWFQFRSSVNDAKILRDHMEVASDSIKMSINKNGELEAEKRALELTAKDLKKQNSILGHDIGELKKEVGSLNNLVSFYKVSSRSSGKGKTEAIDTVFVEVIGEDTVSHKAVTFDWNNEYLTISGLYVPERSEVDLEYDYDLDYTIYTYRKRENKFKFWQKKDLTVKVVFKDPNMTVNQLDNVQVKEKNNIFKSLFRLIF